MATSRCNERIASAIHLTHPAGTEQRQHGIRANLPAHRRGRACEGRRGNVERGCLDEVHRVFRMRQQLFHLPAQCLVFGAGVVEERCTLRWIPLEGVVAEFLEKAVTFRSHGPRRLRL